MVFFARWRTRNLKARGCDGSAASRYLVVVVLAATAFVLAFALFGEKVYETFKDLAERVADAT